jgi:hypothetical protein
MRTEKKDAASFKKITPFEMSKIKGGVWVKVIIDGKTKTIWIDD